MKLATLLKSISLEDAVDVATALKELSMRGVIRAMNFVNLDFSNAVERAYKGLLTFYEASYVITAESTEAILVIEDEKLQETASKFMRAITYTDLESRLAQR